MTKIIDLNKILKDKSIAVDPNYYSEDCNFSLGNAWLIMDVHMQLDLMKQINKQLYFQNETLTPNHMRIEGLLNIMSILIKETVPTFGMQQLTVNLFNGTTDGYAVTFNHFNMNDIKKSVQEGCSRPPMYRLEVTVDKLIDNVVIRSDRLFDIEKLSFDDKELPGNTSFVILAIMRNMTRLVHQNGGFCVFSLENNALVGFIPYSYTQCISITFNTNPALIQVS
jgi:hypothetical protein